MTDRTQQGPAPPRLGTSTRRPRGMKAHSRTAAVLLAAVAVMMVLAAVDDQGRVVNTEIDLMIPPIERNETEEDPEPPDQDRIFKLLM